MGRIRNSHGNVQVVMSFEELLEKGFPQGFAVWDLSKNVPELLGGDMENMIPFQKAFTALGARIVREKSDEYRGKMPTRGIVTLNGNEVTITLGGWKNGPPLP